MEKYGQLSKLLKTEIHLPVRKKDLSIFLRQFSALLESGLGVDESLRLLSQQKDLKSLGKRLERVRDHVMSGGSLYHSFEKEKGFQPLLISMIKVGEETGKLVEVTKQLSFYYEKEYETEQKIRQAMVYPVVLLVTLLVVLFFLFENVIPTFITLFESTQSTLPKSTQFLLAISNFINRYKFFLLLLLFLLVLGFIYISKKEDLKLKRDELFLKLPFFSKHLTRIETGQMIRSLAILSRNEIPFLTSLIIVGEGMNNLYYRQELNRVEKEISSGVSIGQAFQKGEVFPQIFVSMVSVGEGRGNLGEILTTTADFYEKDTDYAIKALTSILEPLMIIIMAVVVGFIVISIATPMFDLINNYNI